MISAQPGVTAVALYAVPPNPDGWHQVAAPGGYESWRFDATDDSGELRLLAELVQGCPYHRSYLSAYSAYRRHPTRLIPPRPEEWPCVHFVLYQKTQVIARFVSEYTAADFTARTDALQVGIGSSRAQAQPDQSIHLVLRSPPNVDTGQQLSATFLFRPLLAGAAIQAWPLLRRDTAAGGVHLWRAARPVCQVEGTVQLHDPANPAQPRIIRFSGRGGHDHAVGTAPPPRGLRRWMFGRVLTPDAAGPAAVFHLSVGRRDDAGRRRMAAHLLRCAPDGSLQSNRVASLETNWDGYTRAWMRYPRRLAMDGEALVLSRPRIIGAEPFALRVAYHATLAGAEGTAFCELIYPRRLRWPGVSRVISR